MTKKNDSTQEKKSYESACEAIVGLHKPGVSIASIAAQLNAAGYPTKRGGSVWYHRNIQKILDERRAESSPKRTTAAKTNALEPKAERRGHKRMTRDGWESLPEPVREAVISRVLTALGL